MNKIKIEGNKITLPHNATRFWLEVSDEGHSECCIFPETGYWHLQNGEPITITREEAPLKFGDMFHRSRSEGGSKWTRHGVVYYAYAEGIILRFNKKRNNEPMPSQTVSIIDLDADWYPYRPEDE